MADEQQTVCCALAYAGEQGDCGSPATLICTAADKRMQWFSCEHHRDLGSPWKVEDLAAWRDKIKARALADQNA